MIQSVIHEDIQVENTISEDEQSINDTEETQSLEDDEESIQEEQPLKAQETRILVLDSDLVDNERDSNLVSIESSSKQDKDSLPSIQRVKWVP